MIAATVLATLLLFGVGGGPFGELITKYTKGPIKTTVVDEDRCEQALHELESLNKAVKEFNKSISKDIKQLDELVKDHHSTPGQFQDLFAGALTTHRPEATQIWDRRSAMLTHIKVEEWQTIMSSTKAKMEEKRKK